MLVFLQPDEAVPGDLLQGVGDWMVAGGEGKPLEYRKQGIELS